MVPGAARGTYFSGDHLNALCRTIARFRLREGRADETRPEDVERALTEWVDKQKLTAPQEIIGAEQEAREEAQRKAERLAEKLRALGINPDEV